MSILRDEVNPAASRRARSAFPAGVSTARSRFMAMAVSLLLTIAPAASAAIPERMKDGLSAGSVKVRLIAIAAVARTKDPEAPALLRPLLSDEAPLVRAAAIDGLGALKDVSAYALIAGFNADTDPAVRKAVTKALKILDSIAIRIDIGDVADLSGRNFPGATARLQDRFETALKQLIKKDVIVARGGVDKGYGALLKIRSVTTSVSEGNGVLEVKCDMTLVELPGKILRLTSTAAAAAGVEGKLPVAMEAELANDAIDACAPSLAKDFADYAEQRIKR